MARHLIAIAVRGHHRCAELVVQSRRASRRLANAARAVDRSAAAGFEGGGPGITLDWCIQDGIGKDTVPFVIAKNLHHSRALARYLTRLLKVGKGEELVFEIGPPTTPPY